MKIQLLRHATLLLYVNNKKILVDPMLSKAGTMEPIKDVPNQNYNPLVDLPLSIDNIIDCNAVLISHTHRDHFDDTAAALLPKNIPIFCQPEDKIKLEALGFHDVHDISVSYSWYGININRTSGQHGHGEIALKMAPVSGFVISANNEPSIYIAGDTVWCSEVQRAIGQFNPNIVVCNGGSAQFSYGEPITMNKEDIHELYNHVPNAKIVVVHMEAWNHCRLTRNDLKDYIKINNISDRIFVPENGESISF